MTHAPTLRRLLAAAALAAPCGAALAGEVDLVRTPSLSPDGSQVVFAWRGDLWKVPASGGHAARLTSHTADESRSAWSPDGRTIAFESDRSGHANVWAMDADGGNVRQVTREDTPLALCGWTPDGRDLVVVARREGDVHPEPRPYLVAAAGGPFRRLHGAFGREAELSPDGARVVFTRGGSTWTRRGYRGADARELWLLDGGAFRRLTDWDGNDGRAHWTSPRELVFTSDREDGTQNVWRMDVATGAVRRVTSFRGEDVWDLAVSRDGATAVCVAWGRLHRIDLRAASPSVTPVGITAPEDEGDRVEVRDVSGEVTEAQLSPDGKVLAVVAFGDVYVRHVDDKHPTRRVTATHAREREIAWSPDGLRLYFVSDESGRDAIRAATVAKTRGELREAFAKETGEKPPAPPAKSEEKEDEKPEGADAPKEGEKPVGDASAADAPDEPAKDDPKPEEKADAPKPAAKKPAKKSPADRWHDAVTFDVATVLEGACNYRNPAPSPDGRSLACRRCGDLVVVDLGADRTKDDAARVLAPGFDPTLDFRWSPDSRWIAYATDDRDFNSDVWVVRADGSAPAVNVSRHPANDGQPRWSADGKVLAFVSERTDHELDVWRVLLDRKLEAMTPEEFAQWQKDAAAAAKKRKPLAADAKPRAAKPADAAEPDLDDAWKRLVRVTTLRGPETNLEVLPGGDGFVFKGKNGADEGLFAVNFDGTNLRRLVPGDKASAQHVSLTGDAVVYVNGGKAGTVPPAGGAAKSLDVAARVVLDREAMAEQRFLEAARIVGDTFYDPAMHGVDWDAQVRRYLPLARRTRTSDEFNFVAECLLGGLNASHLGVRMKDRSTVAGEPNGRLGVDVEPADAPADAPAGGAAAWRIARVVPYGPADKGPMRLAVGDVVLSVEGNAFAPTQTFESAFAGRTGKETLLAVRRGGKELAVLVTPISSGADAELRYDAWAEGNARAVHELSGGRLGYLHIRQMSRASLEEFERDLYAAAHGRDGLVIDVRNNGGGNTADHVLASIMVRPHAYTVPRGADPSMKTGYPRDRLFIQRYVLPTNLLCNEKSFSNAEILAHAFKTLRRGTLVGQTTYGGVISTGGTTTLDGTSVRTPFRGWFLEDGTDMENHGAVPDLLVPQTPDAEARGEDEQLRAAVADLMKRLPATPR